MLCDVGLLIQLEHGILLSGSLAKDAIHKIKKACQSLKKTVCDMLSLLYEFIQSGISLARKT